MRTEKELYQWLKERLNACSIDTMRIESNSTSVGIPDVFAQGRGDDLWIELKVDLIPMEQAMRQGVKLAWRPGQKAWALRYYNTHYRMSVAAGGVSKRHKCSWVVVLLADGVGLIRMTDKKCVDDDNNIIPDTFLPLDSTAGALCSYLHGSVYEYKFERDELGAVR